MLNREWIRITEAFLKERFDQAVWLNDHQKEKDYRIGHSYRVANIGREIAAREGFDETEMVIACLLHDVAYCEEFNENGWIEHGRRSAQIARPFLTELGMKEDRIGDICYGIAIHVDDKADFEGERTAFALSIGDADNIDRFDAYRIHEILSKDAFLDLPLREKEEYLRYRLVILQGLLGIPLGTKTAEELWKTRLTFYISFYERLADQLTYSSGIVI